MKTVQEEGRPVVDVDGSYLYRKYNMFIDAGNSGGSRNVCCQVCSARNMCCWVCSHNIIN